jgi:hypothetical protein
LRGSSAFMLPLMPQTESFCRELAFDEPIAGTAQGEIERWIVLEDNDPWGAKVPLETNLPVAVRDWLKRLEAGPRTRVQLMRRPGRPRHERRTLLLARTPADASGRRLVELECTLADLPSLDPDELLDRAPATHELASVWLVCTHGARDRCCAKWGVALWEALREREGDRVWQCSHLGGHRFAPTAMALPSGLVWGRLALDEVGALVDDSAAGRVGALPKLRGRSAHSSMLQAAECLVRMREGLAEDGALRVREIIPEDPGQRVRFDGPDGVLEIVVELARPGFSSPGSCGEEAKARPYMLARG